MSETFYSINWNRKLDYAHLFNDVAQLKTPNAFLQDPDFKASLMKYYGDAELAKESNTKPGILLSVDSSEKLKNIAVIIPIPGPALPKSLENALFLQTLFSEVAYKNPEEKRKFETYFTEDKQKAIREAVVKTPVTKEFPNVTTYQIHPDLGGLTMYANFLFLFYGVDYPSSNFLCALSKLIEKHEDKQYFKNLIVPTFVLTETETNGFYRFFGDNRNIKTFPSVSSKRDYTWFHNGKELQFKTIKAAKLIKENNCTSSEQKINFINFDDLMTKLEKAANIVTYRGAAEAAALATTLSPAQIQEQKQQSKAIAEAAAARAAKTSTKTPQEPGPLEIEALQQQLIEQLNKQDTELNQKYSEIESLQTQYAELAKKHQDDVKLLADKASRLSLIEGKLAAETQKLQAQEVQTRQSKEETKQLLQKLNDITREKDQLLKQITTLQQVAGQQGDAASKQLLTQLAQTTQQLQAADTEKQRLNDEIKRLEKKNEDIRTQLEAKKEIDNTQNIILAAATKRTEELLKIMEETNKAKDQLAAMQNQLRSENEILRRQLEAQTLETKQLSQQLAEQAKLQNPATADAEKQKLIDDLRGKLQLSEAQRSELQARLEIEQKKMPVGTGQSSSSSSSTKELEELQKLNDEMLEMLEMLPLIFLDHGSNALQRVQIMFINKMKLILQTQGQLRHSERWRALLNKLQFAGTVHRTVTKPRRVLKKVCDDANGTKLKLIDDRVTEEQVDSVQNLAKFMAIYYENIKPLRSKSDYILRSIIYRLSLWPKIMQVVVEGQEPIVLVIKGVSKQVMEKVQRVLIALLDLAIQSRLKENKNERHIQTRFGPRKRRSSTASNRPFGLHQRDFESAINDSEFLQEIFAKCDFV